MPPERPYQVAVCADPEVAEVLIRRGAQVVLCGPDAATLGEAVAALCPTALGPTAGRLAALVGDPADPEVDAAARAMAHELFGSDPLVVATLAQANRMQSPVPGSERTGSGTV